MSVAEDRRRVALRLNVLQWGAVVVFTALAMGFWFLQVVQNAKYEEMAENNHQRTLALRAPRGVLFDRNGTVLVENRHSFTISIVREHSKDLARTVEMLSHVAHLDPHQVQQAVDRHRSEPSYRPIVVVEDATLAQVAAVTARRLDSELPDVVVEEVPARRYPAQAMAAHLFGYVGEANDTQVEAGATQGDIVGQQGFEKAYNDLLMGTDGAKRVVVNSVGREIRTLEEIPPTEGRRVQLTLDADLQRAAEDGFRHAGFNGAALILDPRNGEVLTYTSLPSYDPNDFSVGIDRATWNSLNTDKLKPLQNRVLQGRYSPGSTFKIVVATAALEEGLVTPDFKVTCNGGATFFGRYFKCHLKGGHGTVDMRHALEKSCNVYFYTLGNMLGVDKIHKWAEKLGLAGKTGIDLPNEQESLVPSTEWKMKRYGEKWYAGETISVSIGQGQVAVTPASLAVMISTVANGGTRVTPHVLKAIDEGQGWKPVPAPAVADHVAFKPETLAALRDGLWLVVNGSGTGRRAQIPGYDVAGKTGTAQVISNQGRQAAKGTDRDLRDHGFFVFFAPRDNPQIAGVIFGEHAEHGPLAAPIAKHVIETFFAKKEGRPLPVLPPVPGAPAPLKEDDPDSPPALPAVDVADARGVVHGIDDGRRTLPRDGLMFERRLHFHIDWAMLIAVMALCLIGLANIYSATGGPTGIYVTQIYGIVLGLVALAICLAIDYRTLADKSHFVYGGVVLLLVYVLFLGVVRGGSRRWIDLGPLNLQPSEFAKAALALVLAKFFAEGRRGGVARSDLLIAGAIAVVPLVLIARQPDLGTAVTLVPVLFAGAFVAGMPMRIFGVLALVGVLVAPVAWKFALQDYQKERISTFLDPSQDAKGAGYQQIQARITVGSGGVWGKGFQKGTQGQLRFLPVAHNDFIFSVLAEEHGFAGVLAALGLYLFVILRALEAAALAKDRLGSFLVLGVLASFTFQVVYNITMSAGLAPVKGLTLPLMSYGGSSMIATLAGFGLILNVRMRRFTN